MKKFKVNDEVLIISGKDKGKKGKITSINWKTSRVIVAGCNLVKKSVKADQNNPNGGFVDKEMPLNISSVMHYSAKADRRSRVGIKQHDGKNARFLKACGTIL
jgi:large subunit ribosomal protein L24